MEIEELKASLAGAENVNMAQLAREHFTPNFLLTYREGFVYTARKADAERRRGQVIRYTSDELDKCVSHFCARDLMSDLWTGTVPTLKRFVKPDGRFDLDILVPDPGVLGPRVEENLIGGGNFVYDVTSHMYSSWLARMDRKFLADPDDPLVVKQHIYEAHTMLISGGDWSEMTPIQRTFTRGGCEMYNWMRDYPDLSRQDVELINTNTSAGLEGYANQMAIESTAREQIVMEVTERGGLAYILDEGSMTVVFDPELEGVVKEEEERRKQTGFYDQTDLMLRCPAKFVPSALYSNGNMLHDLLRFRLSVFAEIYLATHGRR